MCPYKDGLACSIAKARFLTLSTGKPVRVCENRLSQLSVFIGVQKNAPAAAAHSLMFSPEVAAELREPFSTHMSMLTPRLYLFIFRNNGSV